MKNQKLQAGLIPVMIKLYDRLLPELRGRLNNHISDISKRLRNNNIEVKLPDKRIISSRKELANAINKLSKSEVNLLIIGHIAYCESGELIEPIKKCNVPILLWPIQHTFKIVPSEFTNSQLAENHGVHGTQDIANLCNRLRIPYGVIHGHLRQKRFITELKEWIAAGKVISEMRQSNPLQIGGWFPNMLDLQIDSADFIKRISPKVTRIAMQDVIKLTKTVTQQEIRDKIKHYKPRFIIDKDINDELLIKTAMNECALRKLISKHKSYAIGINFLSTCNHPKLKDAFHVAASCLMEEGIGYGGEGDWITAMVVRSLNEVIAPATFTEIFSVDYANNRLLLKHWGEGNISLSRKKPNIKKSIFKDKTSAEFCITDFEFKPDDVLIVNLSSTSDGNGKLTIIPGRITNLSLPKITGPRAIFKPIAKDVVETLNRYAKIGGSHHLGMVYTQRYNILEKSAKLMGWKFELIG